MQVLEQTTTFKSKHFFNVLLFLDVSTSLIPHEINVRHTVCDDVTGS